MKPKPASREMRSEALGPGSISSVPTGRDGPAALCHLAFLICHKPTDFVRFLSSITESLKKQKGPVEDFFHVYL